MTESAWYPRTTADVMNLPVGDLVDQQRVTCGNCGHAIVIPRVRGRRVLPHHGDLVIHVTAPEGRWIPEIDESGAWYRRLDRHI